VTRSQITSANMRQTKVKGYSWTVTFASNRHSGVDSHEVWGGVHQGFIKSWGLNVGNLPFMSCVTTGTPLLTTTNPIGIPKCDVCHDDTTCVDGSLPLSGYFTITYDTTLCPPDRCAVQGSFTTQPILHNAPATRAEAVALPGPRVYSVQERLEEAGGLGLANIGIVNVTRSLVNVNTGGYTWTITFQHDTAVDNDRCTSASCDSCPAVGNAYPLTPNYGATLIGTSAIMTNVEVTRGNMLRGTFTLTFDNSGTFTDPIDWDISAEELDTLLQLQDAYPVKTVQVQRSQQGKYGAFTWTITFTENLDQTPTGTGDIPLAIANTGSLVEVGTAATGGCGGAGALACAAGGTTCCAAASFAVTPTDFVEGSTGLGGGFTLTLSGGSSALNVPVTFAYNVSPEDMEADLEAAVPTFDFFVTKREFQFGWQGVAVVNDGTVHLGGNEWNITYLRIPGDVDAAAFPPGAGDADPLGADDSALTGTVASVAIREHVPGSPELSGSFTLSMRGATSGGMTFKATNAEVASTLGALPMVDVVDVVRDVRANSALPGTVTIDALGSSLTTSADLRPYLGAGQMVRIGGGAAGRGYALPGTLAFTPGSATVTSTANLRAALLPGNTLRVRGVDYTVSSTGTGVQLVWVAATGSAPTGRQFSLALDGDAVATCVASDVSAASLQSTLNADTDVANYGGSATGGVTVVRLPLTAAAVTSGVFGTVPVGISGKAGFVYVVYFTGVGWSGTLPPLSITESITDNTCAANAGSSVPAGAAMEVDDDFVPGGAPLTVVLAAPYPASQPPLTGVTGTVAALYARVHASATRTASTLPLGTVADASLAYVHPAVTGPVGAGLAAFSVDGYAWRVSFPSALGNVSTLYSSDARVAVVDDFAEGYLPLSTIVTGLNAGIPYYVTVNAVSSEGAGPESSPSVREIPRGVPDVPSAFALAPVGHRNEVQTITTAATHIDEVQTITTAANRIPEVQIVELLADEGETYDGSSAVFQITLDGLSTAHEKQTLTLTAPVATSLVLGEFLLTLPGAAGACVPFGAEAAAVRALFPGLSVSVFRTSTPSSLTYTFVYTADFTDKAPLTVAYSGCAGLSHVITHTVTTLDEAGVDIPHAVSAEDLETELALLPNVGPVNVLVSLPNARAVLRWTVTLFSLPADVSEFLCDVANAGGVVGADCNVETLSQGNELGGYFLLSLPNEAGHATVQHSASSTDMETALEALTGVGDVIVSRTVLPDLQGGFTWRVTFLDDTDRDPPLLVATNSLLGTNATVTIAEAVKGNWVGGSFGVSFRGEHVRVPFDVTAPALKTSLEAFSGVGTLEVTVSGADVQRGRVWRVTFVDDNLNPGNVDALVVDPTGLTGVGAFVYVEEAVRGSQPSGKHLAVSFSPPAATNEDALLLYALAWDTTASINALHARYGAAVVADPDLLFRVQTLSFVPTVGGMTGYFQLRYKTNLTAIIPYDATADQLRDALEALDTIDTVTVTATVPPAIRSWTVTIHTRSAAELAGLAVEALAITSSPSTTLRITSRSCDRCTTIPGLNEGDVIYAQLAAGNFLGRGPLATASARAVRVPDAPTRVNLTVISGTQLEVFFSPPVSDGGSPILQYCVEWDTVDTFNTPGATSVCGGGRPVLGSRIVNGGAISGTPPFAAVIDGLTAGTRYFVRIHAENIVPFEQLSYTRTPPDNRAWETTSPTSEIPRFLPPLSPTGVSAEVIYGDTIRLYFSETARSGGYPIDGYKIEWDALPTFNSTAGGAPLGTVIVAKSDLELLQGVHWYDVAPLTTSVALYFRVTSRAATIGFGASAVAFPRPLAPVQAPNAPRDLTVSTADLQPLAPITHLDVAWDTPSSTGGLPLSAYKVEWWHAGIVKEVVKVEVTNPGVGTNFILRFDGSTTATLAPDASAITVRYALMSLVPKVGQVTVTRNVLVGTGYQWVITFHDQVVNAGKQPKVQGMLVPVGGASGNINVARVVTGIASGGRNEVAIIATSNNAAAQIGGYFRVSWDASSWSPYLRHDVSPAYLTRVLQNLNTTGVVSVTRSGGALGAYRWTVTFLSNEPNPNIPVIAVDGAMLTPPASSSIEAFDGNNDLVFPVTNTVENGALICEDCVESELPAGYGNATLNPNEFSYHAAGLVPGQLYTVRLSARNARGHGAVATSAQVRLPLQVPSAPTGLEVTVFPGDSTKLLASYAPPVSDGGTPVTKYVIEWSLSPDFTSFWNIEYRCPNSPLYEVVSVSTTGTPTGGYFQLTVDTAGVIATTDRIPWNAVPNAEDEGVGNLHSLDYNTGGSVQSFIEALPNVESVRVSRQVAGTDRYTWSITFLDEGNVGPVSLATSAITGGAVSAPLVVVQGAAYTNCLTGRTIPGLTQGTPYFVRVFAYNKVGFGPPVVKSDTTKPAVVPGRPTSVSLDVMSGTSLVARWSAPLDNGGDAAITYIVEYDDDPLFSTRRRLSMNAVQGGQPFYKEIPGLERGVVYYVRVIAVNSQGESQPQATTPVSEYPREFPTAPTNVRVGVTSGRLGDGKLTVSWGAPTCNGGAEVTAYRVKWDVVNTLNSLELPPNKGEVTVLVTAGMSTTLSDLTPGRSYFISVAAENRVGRRYISSPIVAVPSLRK
jgi:hypothetical protein